ncbi:MAG: glycoside hydrolase N-terminal domain-containing protein [Lentisphaeria bacterium]|nr:glycoside hydrolase N-terminal domain-containing protein [Lentisphaeria bacterium]
MKKTLLAALAILAAFSIVASDLIYRPTRQKKDLLLRQDAPAKDWESQYFPIGNGSLGAMLNGGIIEDELQLNLDTLWSGGDSVNYKRSGDPDANYAEMGSYLPLGTLKVKFDGIKGNEVKNYSRALNITSGVHIVEFEVDGKKQTREAFASYLNADKVLVYHVASETPVSGKVTYRDGREGIQLADGIMFWDGDDGGGAEVLSWAPCTTKYQANGAVFTGVIPPEFRDQNVVTHYLDHKFDKDRGLRYTARMKVLADGWLRTSEDCIEFKDCRELTVLFAAKSGDSSDETEALRQPEKRIAEAEKKPYKDLRSSHITYFRGAVGGVAVDFGGDPELEKLTLAQRVKRCREGKTDPGLVALLFQYGRYLLVSSSHPYSLPANLQGIWNNSNTPAWHSDYHTNINIQMNYWGAEPADLGECHAALLSFFGVRSRAVQLARTDTERELGIPYTPEGGFTFRTSLNAFGEGGWRWNWPSSAWIAQHFYRRWQYGRNRSFLEYDAWPYFQGVARFWFQRLKKRDDGTYVVPQGWSPEHGPVEDGVTHDQQIVAEFFDQYLDIARELKIDNDETKKAAEIRAHLLGNRIGSWGQLQEWETDRDRKGDDHRHTSHLFAVYPGTSIDAVKTPELFRAARVALEGRALTGDARRSWTWPWRAALWARLGDGEKATEMVNSLLRYNTLENLFTTHPPFQIDGNLGIIGAICEMLLQNDSGGIFVLPVDLPEWPDGSFKGLRAYGGFVVSADWKQGKLTRAEFYVERDIELKLHTRTPMVYEGKEATSFTIPMKKYATVVLTAPEQK